MIWRALFLAAALALAAWALFGMGPAHAQAGITCATRTIAFHGLPEPDQTLSAGQARRMMAEFAARAGQHPIPVDGAVVWRRGAYVLPLWLMGGLWCRLSPNPQPAGAWNEVSRTVFGQGL